MLLGRTSRIQLFGKQLLLLACLFMPAQPALAAIVTDAKELGQSEVSKVTNRKKVKRTRWQNFKTNLGRGARTLRDKLGKTEFVATENEKLAEIAYGQGPIEKIKETDFITPIEAKELMLNSVTLYLASHAQTSFGAKALENMVISFDKEQMFDTQSNIKRLVGDDATYEKIEKLLQWFGKHEGALLKYWDPKKKQNGYQPHLFAKADELNLEKTLKYGKTLDVGIPVVDELPNPAYYVITKPSQLMFKTESPNSKAMATWLRIGSSAFHWVYAICVSKNFSTFVRKIMLEGAIKNPIKNAPKELWASLAATILFWRPTEHLQSLTKKHTLWKNAEKEDSPFKDMIADGLTKEYNDIIDNGSYADVVLKTYRELHPPSTDTDEMGKWVAEKSAGAAGVFAPSFMKGGASGVTSTIKWLTPAFIQAVAQKIASGSSMAFKDISWWLPAFYYLSERTAYAARAFKQSFFGFAMYHYAWEKLQDHATELATCLRSIRSIKNILTKDSQLKDGVSCALLNESLSDTPTKDFCKVMKLAHSSVFVKKKYRGGHAQILHELMLKVAPEFQSALHGIGYLDAVFSVAKLIRQNKGKPSQLCFVDWLPDEDERAQIDVENGTLLIMPNAEPNSMRLGFENPSNKAILTGPNGAGKSVFIKMLGSNVILAHAFGIASAEKMSMHWLERLRTSIDPAESIADDLSKMQAQNVRMDNVVNELFHITKEDKSKKGMFLTDEPLSGTTARAASRKLRTYCERIGTMPQMSGVMATHNEEPTKFEDKGFVNYRVCIKEVNDNVFLPSFKVEPGIPEWWFSKDPEGEKKVDNFIAYTVAIKHKHNIEESISDFSKKYDELEKIVEGGRVPPRDRGRIKGVKRRIYIRIDQLKIDLEDAKLRISQLEKGEHL